VVNGGSAVKRRRSRITGEAAELEMTPMIDVVFLLLIFFLVAFKQEDILSHLDVFRPAPDPSAREEEQIRDLLTITVHPGGYMLKDRTASLHTIEDRLTRLASYSSDISVIIKCSGDSEHEKLVNVLNICAKVGLKNLSVFSM
jgi:biopolymer transport protein ExbD